MSWGDFAGFRFGLPPIFLGARILTQPFKVIATSQACAQGQVARRGLCQVPRAKNLSESDLGLSGVWPENMGMGQN